MVVRRTDEKWSRHLNHERREKCEPEHKIPLSEISRYEVQRGQQSHKRCLRDSNKSLWRDYAARHPAILANIAQFLFGENCGISLVEVRYKPGSERSEEVQGVKETLCVWVSQSSALKTKIL